MTPEMQYALIFGLAIIAILLFTFALGGGIVDIADRVLSGVPFIKKWVESLPMFYCSEELKQDEDYRRVSGSARRRVERRRSGYRKTVKRGAAR